MTRYKEFSSPSKEKQGLLDKSSNDWISARTVLTIMAFFGFLNVYTLRINLSVGMVAMTKSTDGTNNSYESHECPDPTGTNASATREDEGEFDWNEIIQGHLLGSFYYGYMVTQIPGGLWSNRFGGKNVFGLSVLFTSVLSLLTPVAARCSVYLFIVVRVLEGLCGGVVYPAWHSIMGQWAPVCERSTLASFAYSGGLVGACISFPIAGFLCDSDFMGGWPSIFYVFGFVGIIWYVAWTFIIHDSPAEHPRISKEEKEYIESSTGKKEVLATPWRAILTSPAVLCICVCQCCAQWGYYMLLSCLPTYLKTIHKFDIKSNGLLSALPYLVLSVVLCFVGYIADFIRSRGYLSTGGTRKAMTAIGLIFHSVLLILCGFMGCDHTTVIILVTIAVSFYSFTYVGFFVNHLDFAPRLAGILMGVTNCIGTIPGFLAPVVVGYLTYNNQTMEQWLKIFYINAGITAFGCVVYIMFAEGEELPWARSPEEKNGIENGVHHPQNGTSGTTNGTKPDYHSLTDENTKEVETPFQG